LANSDGCSRVQDEPNWSQFRLPFTVTPSGVNVSMSRINVTMRAGQLIERRSRGDRRVNSQAAPRPMTRNIT